MIFQLVAILFVLLLLIISISKWKLHPFIALVLAAVLLGLLVGLGGKGTVEVLLNGFGSTMKWIAIVVVLGAFIGEVLNETGGAIRISDNVLKLVGQKRLPWAMGITGYIVSIPVFVDVAYILFQPVTEALARRSRSPVLVVGLALTAGLTVSHTLMPPTPGPLAVASLLEANIGRMLLINSFAAIFAVTGGVIWAKYYCKKFILPLDSSTSVDREREERPRPDHAYGKVFSDVLPIIVPVVLMSAGALLEGHKHWICEMLAFVSTPVIAVGIGAGIAAFRYSQTANSPHLNRLVESAIVKSALVIMITGAGGALGFVIRESGVQDSIGTFFAGLPYLGFMLPFIMAAVLTSSTGSITVSLIGAGSVLGPIASGMPYSREVMAALIGCGSFCVFHANSSFFWLLNRLHDVPVNTLYKTYTIQSLIMGLSGLTGILFLLSIGIT
ncbi:MAG: GntP family permease [Cytophagales bacterium]|nr:GntP family permease [Cytophagales bacterium]